MMVMGTVMAGNFGWHYGPYVAIVAGAIGGLVAGLLMSLATTTFGVNHIIAGFAINIIGPGVARFLANTWFTTPSAVAAGGSISNSPPVDGRFPRVSLPILSSGPDLLGRIEAKGWFLISDVAGILHGLTSDVQLDTIICLCLIAIGGYVVWHTPFGLRLRSAGEKPSAAESLGVSVLSMRHAGMAISGAFAGIGGAVIVFAGANRYQEGQTVGTGFLGLASLVFGNWRPLGVLAGAGVFGFAQGIAYNLTASSLVLGLILGSGIALVLVAIRAIIRRDFNTAIASVIVAALAFVVYAVVDSVNNQFIYMTPYVVTLVVVTIFAKRLRPPAAEGIPYFKGEQL
jgi:simple sugar transport system permease protein